MVKIRCVSLDGGYLFSNRYKGITGQEYIFHKNTSTEVKNREDAEYFLKAGKGELFKKVTIAGEVIADVKKALSEVAKEFPLSKKKETTEELKVEKPEVKEEKKEEPKPEVKEESKLYTATQIKAESKKWQINLLKKLGSKSIPGLESKRIELILKLQKTIGGG